VSAAHASSRSGSNRFCSRCLVVAPLHPYSSDVRDIHARISIRKTRSQGPPPSPDEIDAWLGTYPGGRGGITDATLFDAFNVGDETLDFAVIKCVGYNADVAKKLRGQMAPNWPNSSFTQPWEAAVVRN